MCVPPIQVLDARDPMGTRSKTLEKYLRAEKKYKHLVFVLGRSPAPPSPSPSPPWSSPPRPPPIAAHPQRVDRG